MSRREGGIDNKKATGVIPHAMSMPEDENSKPAFYNSSDEESPGFIIPMRLGDCFAFGKDGM